jgi:hypothetical protein
MIDAIIVHRESVRTRLGLTSHESSMVIVRVLPRINGYSFLRNALGIIRSHSQLQPFYNFKSFVLGKTDMLCA